MTTKQRVHVVVWGIRMFPPSQFIYKVMKLSLGLMYIMTGVMTKDSQCIQRSGPMDTMGLLRVDFPRYADIIWNICSGELRMLGIGSVSILHDVSVFLFAFWLRFDDSYCRKYTLND